MPAKPMDHKSIRAVAFIARCSGAGTAAYVLAVALGLPESVWAAMSALIVSQERLHETRSSLTGRVLGTLLGIMVTVVVSTVAAHTRASTALQMAIAVAICALVTREFPKLRVAMWTCPIVLLTAQSSVPIATAPIAAAALYRGGEVILGAVVGWLSHWVAEVLVDICGAAARALPLHHLARRGAGRRHPTHQI
ncbi:MAG TPA: FUSC family protein [Dongiaceae bacterium]|nr:FUSC family protein [Dongiaceae bacterium]